MSYLSVVNFWKFQNADAWKKSKGHPPWYKHFVHRDRDIDRLPVEARLLWYEILGAATRYSNVLEADLNWLYAETRIEPDTIREMLPLLLKGGWLSETRTQRRSRKPSRRNPPDPLPLIRIEEEEEKDQNQGLFVPPLPAPPPGDEKPSADYPDQVRLAVIRSLEGEAA